MDEKKNQENSADILDLLLYSVIMSKQKSNHQTYLKRLQTSQSIFESSKNALKAAEEAFNAAKIVNVDAKVVLDAEREAYNAFKTAIFKASLPPFLLFSSSGPASDLHGGMLGLYRKTGEKSERRSVYKQDHEVNYEAKILLSYKGVWSVMMHTDAFGNTEYLRAAKPSKSPSQTVKWQYRDYPWGDDLALTVTGLNEKPSCECEVTISLSQDVERYIMEPGVAGVYTADGSYWNGRPVLQHSGGRFTLLVLGSCWSVEVRSGWSAVGGGDILCSGSVPSQCPADPRAARDEKQEETHWKYWIKLNHGWAESRGISVKCNKCIF